MNCPHCGNENVPGINSCVVCSLPLRIDTKSTCHKCGALNPWDGLYCVVCGQLLVRSAATTPTVNRGITTIYAGFWIRAFAYIIDQLVIGISLGVIFAILGPDIAIQNAHLFDLGSPLVRWIWAFMWLYNTVLIGLKGQTLGKMILKIRVENVHGEVPGLVSAVLREIPGKIISVMTFYLGFVWAVFDDKKQAWHDKAARTYVVRIG